MNEIFVMILSTATTAIILPLIALGGKALLNYINEKIKNEKLKEALASVVELTEKSVDMIAQTFVDDLKKQGKFDQNTQAAALNYAIENVKGLLTKETSELITANVGCIDNYLKTLAEAYIKKSKE